MRGIEPNRSKIEVFAERPRFEPARDSSKIERSGSERFSERLEAEETRGHQRAELRREAETAAGRREVQPRREEERSRLEGRRDDRQEERRDNRLEGQTLSVRHDEDVRAERGSEGEAEEVGPGPIVEQVRAESILALMAVALKPNSVATEGAVTVASRETAAAPAPQALEAEVSSHTRGLASGSGAGSESPPQDAVDTTGNGPSQTAESSAPESEDAGALKLTEFARPKLENAEVLQLVTAPGIELDAQADEGEIESLSEKLDFQDIRPELSSLRNLERGAPIHASRPIGEQITDAVQKLMAEQSDSDGNTIRFQTEDGQTFTASIRQDGRGLDLRLMSDDGTTRALLGERLPELRQALERAGLSAQVTVDRDGQNGSRPDAYSTPPDEMPPTTAPLKRRMTETTETSGLHLVL